MLLQQISGVMFHQQNIWKTIRERRYTIQECYTHVLVWLCAIPPVSFFIGTTQVGWSVGTGSYVKLTTDSAFMIAVVFYIALLVGVAFIANVIHWMEKTYGAQSDLAHCMVLATCTATPLLLAGITGLWPMLWFVVGVGLIALAYTVYILYSGVPELMNIPADRGFMFSTSILTVGMVVLVSMLASTVVLWDLGISPTFVSG
ncbi:MULTISPECIES: Yip1 family protein [Bacteria]|uniref:Inner membrane protein yohC n=1 Tax=Nitrincola nitratireducens TaxID=1229521 RepID=W9V726_9GAMM|nr:MULTISPECIES: Yip1 family protein [Nitrincola]EXJ11872.1 Inner membrane protein yohC [Nitrincola nitratireducens]